MNTPPTSRRTAIVRDRTALVWLAAAAFTTLIHRWVPASTWLMIHLVVLGAATHAAMVWSEHFATTLLRTAPGDGRHRRFYLLAAGSLLVFLGVPLSQWWLVLIGGVGVGLAICWHAALLVVAMRRALPTRFAKVVRYYAMAACLLVVGITFGVILASGLGDEWHARLLVAHLSTNVLGWLGLTLLGTLVTFWPTMLRTRMADRAEPWSRQALPVLVAGILVVDTGALAGLRWLSVSGLVLYVLGALWAGRGLVAPLRAAPPREFAPASVGLGLLWGLGGTVWLGWLLVTHPWPEVASSAVTLGGVLAAGLAVQVVTGALSYLLPAMLKGGPAATKAAQAEFNRWAGWRLGTINGGMLLWLAPVPSWVKVTSSSLVLVAMAAFLVLLARGIRASIQATRPPAEKPAKKPTALTVRGFAAAALTLAVAVLAGVAVDPAAAGLAPSQAAMVTPTGRTTTVEVQANGMRFTPNRITVSAGDRLVIALVNTDSTQTHDLQIGSAHTPRLAPGERAELDVGVVGASTQGWCTVAGHRQMGMVLDIVVEGRTQAAPAASASSAAPAATAAPSGDLSRTVDASLPPLTADRVRKVAFEITEVSLEVAPGVWQKRWTFNGGSVGPTLHGRIGDTFEVTLVNHGSMGHSLDFHAGTLAPDVPMRTIPPGESLVYRFTATRAGIWMYHCSTAPMSAHIAAGMHGAVVIEPEGLPAVDRSYVLVQSEIYLSSQASTADAATEVNVDKVTARTPDRMAFNGIANQYDQVPLTATVGQRVRVWVLAAGPNRGTSFHVVGGQFDTVYKEGAYLLRDGWDAFGSAGGGSQALDLAPAQGGFVELALPEAGRYPFVTHIMSDAEAGAHGFIVAS